MGDPATWLTQQYLLKNLIVTHCLFIFFNQNKIFLIYKKIGLTRSKLNDSSKTPDPAHRLGLKKSIWKLKSLT